MEHTPQTAPQSGPRHPSAKETLKEELRKALNLLQMLRDEVRVRLHLGGLDAKGEWDRIEPHIFDAERAAHSATGASKRILADAIERLKRLRAAL